MNPVDELRQAAQAVLEWWDSDGDHHQEFERLRKALAAMPPGDQGVISNHAVNVAYRRYHEGLA